MGFALAEVLAEYGADVYLIAGPVLINSLHHDIKRYDVITAGQMYEKAIELFPHMQIAVLCAAVADFKPAWYSKEKIKKTGEDLYLRLIPTPDIASELGKRKKKFQFIAGFALESENGIQNAQEKCLKKNMDMIVLNSLNQQDGGIKSDMNEITLIDNQNNIDKFELKKKKDVAKDIIQKICEKI